jgi:hypothetical protein
MLEIRESCGHVKEGGWCEYCISLWKEAYTKGKRDSVVKKKAYMCLTDYDYELESARGGVKVFSSIEDLKNHRKCWSDCGIVEVEISFNRQ